MLMLSHKQIIIIAIILFNYQCGDLIGMNKIRVIRLDALEILFVYYEVASSEIRTNLLSICTNKMMSLL